MKEKRLIYAEDLKQLREDFIAGKIELDSETDMVDACPTVNPEDLRPKGKWLGLEYNGYADGLPVYDLWECSNCGNEESGDDVPERNPFCRWCGAKMEAET